MQGENLDNHRQIMDNRRLDNWVAFVRRVSRKSQADLVGCERTDSSLNLKGLIRRSILLIGTSREAVQRISPFTPNEFRLAVPGNKMMQRVLINP